MPKAKGEKKIEELEISEFGVNGLEANFQGETKSHGDMMWKDTDVSAIAEEVFLLKKKLNEVINKLNAKS